VVLSIFISGRISSISRRIYELFWNLFYTKLKLYIKYLEKVNFEKAITALPDPFQLSCCNEE